MHYLVCFQQRNHSNMLLDKWGLICILEEKIVSWHSSHTPLSMKAILPAKHICRTSISVKSAIGRNCGAMLHLDFNPITGHGGWLISPLMAEESLDVGSGMCVNSRGGGKRSVHPSLLTAGTGEGSFIIILERGVGAPLHHITLR